MARYDFWPEIEIRHLVAFLAVCEHGTFGDAAAASGYTQSAVSHQIATLERIVGAKLIDRRRGRGRPTLTPAGEILRAHAEAVASRLAAATADLRAVGDGRSGRLRVGAFQSVSAQIIPHLVCRLARELPDLQVELAESADEADLMHRLVQGELDFAFTLLPALQDGIHTEELLHDSYFLVAGSQSPFAVDITSLADLEGVPIVAPRTCRSIQMIAGQIRAAGVQPRFVFRSDDDLALRALVQSGVGVAFFPDLTMRSLGGGLRAGSLDGLIPARRIAIAWSEDRPCGAAGERFLVYARAAAAAASGLRAVPLAG